MYKKFARYIFDNLTKNNICIIMSNYIYRMITSYALNLPRVVKRTLAIFLDTILCVFAIWIALTLRLEKIVFFNWQYIFPTLVSIGVAIPIFFSWGLYSTIFRYSSGRAIRVLAKSITLYMCIFASIFSFLSIEGIPRSIGIMQPMILFFAYWSFKVVG